MLMDRGFQLVRPLAGGLEAWVKSGYAIDGEPLIAIRETGAYDRASIDQSGK